MSKWDTKTWPKWGCSRVKSSFPKWGVPVLTPQCDHEHQLWISVCWQNCRISQQSRDLTRTSQTGVHAQHRYLFLFPFLVHLFIECFPRPSSAPYCPLLLYSTSLYHLCQKKKNTKKKGWVLNNRNTSHFPLGQRSRGSCTCVWSQIPLCLFFQSGIRPTLLPEDCESVKQYFPFFLSFVLIPCRHLLM